MKTNFLPGDLIRVERPITYSKGKYSHCPNGFNRSIDNSSFDYLHNENSTLLILQTVPCTDERFPNESFLFCLNEEGIFWIYDLDMIKI